MTSFRRRLLCALACLAVGAAGCAAPAGSSTTAPGVVRTAGPVAGRTAVPTGPRRSDDRAASTGDFGLEPTGSRGGARGVRGGGGGTNVVDRGPRQGGGR